LNLLTKFTKIKCLKPQKNKTCLYNLVYNSVNHYFRCKKNRKMQIEIKNYFWGAILTTLLMGCGSETKVESFTIENINLVAEGPLYEGSNTAQAELKNMLTSFLETKKIKPENIENITIQSCNLTIEDSANFNIFQSINIQLASENSEMQNIAIINPIAKNKNIQLLKVAEKQEKIKDILLDKMCFVVADAIIVADTAMNINLNCNLTINIKYIP